MGRAAVTREQGNTAKVQHGQDVGIGQFVLEAEADNLKGRQRPVGFKGDNRQMVLAELLLHVQPRCVDALRLNIGTIIEQIIQNL